MNVLVVGATGRLGSAVVNRALEDGHEVTALARNPAAVPNAHREWLTVARGDVLDPASLAAAMPGHDAVISCLGTRDRKQSTLRTDGIRNVLSAMSSAGVRRIVVFSAFGVGDSREQLKRTTFTFGRIILPLLLAGQFEDMRRMEDLVRASDLDWIIVRPTALTDEPATNAVKVADPAQKAGSAIPIADVAQFMVDSLTSDEHMGASPVIYA